MLRIVVKSVVSTAPAGRVTNVSSSSDSCNTALTGCLRRYVEIIAPSVSTIVACVIAVLVSRDCGGLRWTLIPAARRRVVSCRGFVFRGGCHIEMLCPSEREHKGVDFCLAIALSIRSPASAMLSGNAFETVSD